MAKQRITIEEANSVLNRHRAELLRQEVTEKRAKYVGRFFRYRNRSSDRSWWLYAAVEGVNSHGRLRGWMFERMSDGEIRIDVTYMQSVSIGNGWSEITPAHFWREAKKLQRIVVNRLSGKGRTK